MNLKTEALYDKKPQCKIPHNRRMFELTVYVYVKSTDGPVQSWNNTSIEFPKYR